MPEYSQRARCGQTVTFTWSFEDQSKLSAGDVLNLGFRLDGVTSNPWLFRNVATVAYPVDEWTYTFPAPLDGGFTDGAGEAEPLTNDGTSFDLILFIEKAEDPSVNSANVVSEFELQDTPFFLSCSAKDIEAAASPTRRPSAAPSTSVQATPTETTKRKERGTTLEIENSSNAVAVRFGLTEFAQLLTFAFFTAKSFATLL